MSFNGQSSRRNWLKVSAAALAAAAAGNWQLPQISAADEAELTRSLRQLAAAKGLFFGPATGKELLELDKFYAERIGKECNILVAENDLKWPTIHPAADRYDFGPGDYLADFARRHQMLIRGHTLLWWAANPQWLLDSIKPQNAAQLMTDHINTVVKHYAGQMHSWDVVNEAVDIRSKRPDKLGGSVWLEQVGGDYIDLAFRTAAAADPQAMLVYNDYGIDYGNQAESDKRAAILALLTNLKAKGTPVQALGIQAHLQGDRAGEFDAAKLRTFLREVGQLGLKIIITEMDVSDNTLPTDAAYRDRVISDQYARYLDVVLEEQATIGVLTWGFSDKYSWLNYFFPRSDGTKQRPLPFDEYMQPKTTALAVAAAFNRAPTRLEPASQYFDNTKFMVKGEFLDYWRKNGDIAQQGYPLSDEFIELREGNVPRKVQYFERALFESHPENQPLYNVLLALLGSYYYNKRYPQGAPDQTASTASGAITFEKTGKTLGGRFLEYWQQNGGLAQQGYPISNEFTEINASDGLPYKVQYFERAVFELHPDNAKPYDVLLSLLGRRYLNEKYGG